MPSARAAPLNEPLRVIASTQRRSSQSSAPVRFCKTGLRIFGIPEVTGRPYVACAANQAGSKDQKMLNFKDKVVLVTGATAGIGRATAEAFAAAGATLVLTARNAAAGAELRSSLRTRGTKVAFLQGDVAREETVRSWIEATAQEFGRLDVAVNNAGIEGQLGPIADQTAENFERVFDANVKGMLFALKHQIPLIAKQGGAIVNVSSMVGEIGMAGASVYVASKHAVNGLTRSAALETARMGIRVNASA